MTYNNSKFEVGQWRNVCSHYTYAKDIIKILFTNDKYGQVIVTHYCEIWGKFSFAIPRFFYYILLKWYSVSLDDRRTTVHTLCLHSQTFKFGIRPTIFWLFLRNKKHGHILSKEKIDDKLYISTDMYTVIEVSGTDRQYMTGPTRGRDMC